MNQVRGIILIVLGGWAVFQGWRIHTGQRAWLAYGIGLLAVAVGLWRLLRKPPQRLI